jgi:diguanylate cyclase (GGDEF)-like protein
LEDAEMQQFHPVTAEFRDVRIEREFRASVLREVQRDSRLTLSVAAVLTVMFLISDYVFLGLSDPFYPLLVVRAVVTAGCLFLAVFLGSSDALLTRPWLYSVAPVLVATGTFFVAWLRPETLPTQLVAVVIVVMAIYLFAPNLIWGMIGSSLYLSAGFLISAWYWAGVTAGVVVAFGILLVLANAVGYFAAQRVARLQRRQYALLVDERHSKHRLMDEVARREALEQRLRDMAQTDDLTGLSNRRHFVDSAQAALLLAREAAAPFSLCMIDIDNFKKINDQWGHACGDRVLRRVAETCREALGAEVPIGRFGGEEFVAALPGTGLDEARLIAERLRTTISDLRFDGEPAALRVTVTIGVSEVPAEEAELEPVLDRADAALYEGKRSGRNIVVDATLGRPA